AAAVDWSSIGVTAGAYALFGPAIAVGWALREFEIYGADSPAEGLTPEVLKQQVYQSAKTRASTNASTIVDNRNILDGLEHTAYTEAKIAAIEKLNAGESESNVLDAATSAVNSYFATVESNYIKSWNESVLELEQLANSLSSHTDTATTDVLSGAESGSFPPDPSLFKTKTATLADGTTLDIQTIEFNRDNDTYDYNFRLQNLDPGSGGLQKVWVSHDGDTFTYLDYADWNPVWSDMQSKLTNVRNGISTWVSSVYGDVQSGDIEISDLVTPKERAAMMSKEEGMSQAIADLIALNIPVDPEREATITMGDTGATISGTFALTDPSDGPLETGQTYDTSNFSGDVYFTADMSLVEGDWSAYQTGVDGGNITLTEDPYDGTAVELETAANETVTVDSGNWTATGNGTWYYDASADLETDITEIVSARFLSTSTETQFETFQIQGSFTVDKLVNTQSGEEVTSTSFENSEPQTDSNYITQDEWDQLEQQNQELIEKYENSQSGGGIDLGQFDMFGIPGEIVAVIAAALVALGVLGN
ncbi:hypothetical protein, partial [Halorubrum sp. SS7]|uniref:hypothetical protein n=1 Tax=Halorubrum sp. SS7 TaxID=2518119 RepID=UPI00130511C1